MPPANGPPRLPQVVPPTYKPPELSGDAAGARSVQFVLPQLFPHWLHRFLLALERLRIVVVVLLVDFR